MWCVMPSTHPNPYVEHIDIVICNALIDGIYSIYQFEFWAWFLSEYILDFPIYMYNEDSISAFVLH